MDLRTLVSLVVSVVMLPVGAMAQDASESPRGGIRLEIKQSEIPVAKGRLPIVRPVPALGVATEDAARLVADLEAARRQKEIAREVTGRSARRPDLDYDITNGIQQHNLMKARPR